MQLTQQPLSSRSYARRALRRAVNLRCYLMGAKWDRPLPCRASDLSPFGIKLETSAHVDVGEPVVVSFQPPRHDSELTLFATVVRVATGTLDSEVGLYFRVGAADQTILEACLRGLPPPLPVEP